MDADRHNPRFGLAPRRHRRAVLRRFSPRVIKGPQTVEAYLKGNSLPRYMQRLREIDIEYKTQRRRLEIAYRALGEAFGHDPEVFSYQWRVQARAWPFHRLNELIREHNEWYPVEASLPMDPRTRDYVPVHGMSYRRIELGPDWVLEHFPPVPGSAMETPNVPARAPCEPP